jgi:hypothetical protein
MQMVQKPDITDRRNIRSEQLVTMAARGIEKVHLFL